MNIGLLNINKPKGLTSHDIVQRLRILTGIERMGHTGTLDPIASGVLVIAIGKATKLIEYIEGGEKKYIATLKLGYRSKTLDSESELVPTKHNIDLNLLDWDNILRKYIGEISQVPPDFSAIKINGKRAYKLASKDQKFDIEPRIIRIDSIKIINIDYPFVKIEVTCGRGTYIRSLVRDIGEDIGIGAVMTDLIRIENNGFEIEDAINFEDLNIEKIEEAIIDLYEVFKDKAIIVSNAELREISFGRYIKLNENRDLLIAFDKDKKAVAVLNRFGDLYGPKKVLIDQLK